MQATGISALRWQSSQVWLLFAMGLVALGGLALLYSYDPAGSTPYPQCPFHALTGLHCPGCGTLRALHQLLHGNVLTALGLNPLMALSMPFLGYAFLSKASLAVRGVSLPGVFIQPAWIWMLFWTVVLSWTLRNVPLYPFSTLAP